MSRAPKSWARIAKEARRRGAFSDAEDAALCDMVRCGLSVDYYKSQLEQRSLGEILDRRLTLVEAGAVTHPRAI